MDLLTSYLIALLALGGVLVVVGLWGMTDARTSNRIEKELNRWNS